MTPLLLIAGVVQTAAASSSDPADAAPQVTAAAHARNIEAFAAPDIQKSTPTAIVAMNAEQLRDPTFRPIANRLGAALVAQGFNVVTRGEAFRNVVVLQYRVNLDVHGGPPGTQTSDPRVTRALGPAAFPAYRRLTVTAYAVKGRGRPELLWRTVMAEDGFDQDVGRTIPPLVEAGRTYFGRNLTALAVADCDEFAPPGGSHVAGVPCGPVRTLLSGGVVRTPRVIVETAPDPEGKTAQPSR